MAAAYATVVVRAARRHGAPLRPDLPGIKIAATSSIPLLIRTLALRLALLAGTVLAARYRVVARLVVNEVGHNELRRAQREAETLTDLMVHDLKGPLTGLIGLAETYGGEAPLRALSCALTRSRW